MLEYSMSDISQVLEKVRRLLSLSKSDNANEAATAVAAANRLLDQHRLSMDDVGTNSIDEALEFDEGYVYQTKKKTLWKHELLRTLNEHYGLAMFNDLKWDKGRKVSNFKLVGRRSDIQIVHYMYAWLSSECARLSTKEARGKGRTYVSSYCLGFVRGVKEQLKASREEARQKISSEAIVKLDTRVADAKKFMFNSRNDIRNVKISSSSRIDTNAIDAGRSKGRSIHLGRSIENAKVRLLQ